MMKFINKITATLLTISIIFFGFSFNVSHASVPVLETNPELLAAETVTSISTSGNLTKRIQEFVFKIFTESLKRKLLDSVVSQIVTGVAGGQPKFVTNWESYLNKNYRLGESEGLRKARQAGLLNGGNYVDALIESRYNPNVNIPKAPTPSNEPFTYKKYLDLWKPQNNYFGKTIIVDEIVRREATLKREAAQNEAIAGKGFLSTKDEAGQITTPGSVVGDSVSRAITSDIDYIVNSDDIASFASSLGSSVFNRLISQSNSGLAGLARGILTGDNSIGSFSLNSIKGINGEVGVEGLLNEPGKLGQISLNIDTNQILRGLENQATNQIVNQIVFDNDQKSSRPGSTGNSLLDISDGLSDLTSDFNQSQINNQLTNTLDLETELSSLGLNFSANLGKYERNKIDSYIEVQKAIWYLEDIKNSMTLEIKKTNSLVDLTSKDFSHLDNTQNKFPRNGNCLPILNINKISNKEQLKQSIDERITKIEEGIFQKLNHELENFDGEATEEELLISANEKELLHNLFLADMTVKNSSSDNFDILNTLPINLNESNTKINKFHRGYCSSQGWYYIDRSTNLNFFQNQIQFKFGNSTSGQGNYLGLTISPTNNEHFYLHPERIDSYLENLDIIIDDLNKLSSDSEKSLAETMSEESLAKTIAYRQNKEGSAVELLKAKQYVKSVDSQGRQTEYNILNKNLTKIISQIGDIIDEDNKVKVSKDQARALEDLFLADIAKVDRVNFDVTEKLPINLTQTEDSIEILSASGTTNPIKISLAPYSGNQNFLGYTINTRFFRHSNNDENYFTALNDKLKLLDENQIIEID